MSSSSDDLVQTSASPKADAVGALVALTVHAAVLVIALQCEATSARAPLPITEIDLTPVQPALGSQHAPPPDPPVTQPAPASSAAPVKHAPRAFHKPAPPAAAGALHTAREDSPDLAEPVRFAVDAHGASYGFGVVARVGSSSTQAGGTYTPSALPSAGASPSRAARPRSFAVPPRLTEMDPCRGFFPVSASADRGEVTVLLRIAADGIVQRVTVHREEPAGQGFGASAVRCLKTKRFVAARDQNDAPVIAEAPVTLRFSR